jgi:hypothetical protein
MINFKQELLKLLDKEKESGLVDIKLALAESLPNLINAFRDKIPFKNVSVSLKLFKETYYMVTAPSTVEFII